MPANRATHEPLLTPEQVGDLVITPLGTSSVAGRVSTYVETSRPSYRLPVVVDDPSAAWVDELEEIPLSEGEVDEVSTEFKKLAALTLVSNELIDDSDDEALEVLGAGMVRDLAVKVDGAYFGPRPSAKAPAGLRSLAGVTEVDAGPAWVNADPFNAAIFGAAGFGRQVTAFVTSPADALVLANLKEGSGTERMLLQPDATQPSRRVVAGVPLETSPAVEPGVVWAIPRAVAYVVVRQDAEVELDGSAAFTRDGSFIRSKLRADFLFPHPASIHRISLSG